MAGLVGLEPMFRMGMQPMIFLPLEFEPMFRMLNRRDCPLDRSLVSHEITSDETSATGIRTYVPFAQSSLLALGARSPLVSR